MGTFDFFLFFWQTFCYVFTSLSHAHIFRGTYLLHVFYSHFLIFSFFLENREIPHQHQGFWYGPCYIDSFSSSQGRLFLRGISLIYMY